MNRLKMTGTILGIICMLQPILSQNSLTLTSSQTFVSTFTKSAGRHVVDTLVVPQGHLFKVENCALGELKTWNGQTYIETCPHYAIEIDNVLVYAQNQTQNTSYHNLFQQSSLPLWLNAGTHYIYFNTGYGTPFTSRLSIHGLLFSHQ